MGINRILLGNRPTAFSTGTDDTGATVLVHPAGTLRLEGDMDARRKAAQAIAEAVGLSVVDPGHPVVPPAPRDRDHLRTT